jgi:predicted Fe-Mo cluster-binding NifX family protein
MRLLLATFQRRISPVLDTASQFLLVDLGGEEELGRRSVRVETTDPVTRIKRLAGFDADVLICGAVSRPLKAMLASAGLQVIPNTCGPVEEVIRAFATGRLTDGAFLLPGCSGSRRPVRDGRGQGQND